MAKYNIGDKVIVVHRMSGTFYYSWSLEGFIGTISKYKEKSNGETIYKLDHTMIIDDRVDGDAADLASKAWYEESCLDPAPADIEVSDDDFNQIFDEVSA